MWEAPQNLNRPSLRIWIFLKRIYCRLTVSTHFLSGLIGHAVHSHLILSGLLNGLLIYQLQFGCILSLSLAVNLSCVSDISGFLCTVIWMNKKKKKSLWYAGGGESSFTPQESKRELLILTDHGLRAGLCYQPKYSSFHEIHLCKG